MGESEEGMSPYIGCCVGIGEGGARSLKGPKNSSGWLPIHPGQTGPSLDTKHWLSFAMLVDEMAEFVFRVPSTIHKECLLTSRSSLSGREGG